MASIQQSLNQLLGAAAGAITAGSYMYRQSPTHQANLIKKAAEGEAAAAIQRGHTEKAAKIMEKTKMEQLENSPVVAPQKQNAVFNAKLKAEAAEIREQGAEKAFLVNPSGKNQIEWTKASRERIMAQIGQKTLERQRERIKEIRETREGMTRRKTWLKTMEANLNAPGDTSPDRLKLATITRDVKFKEKHKGEID